MDKHAELSEGDRQRLYLRLSLLGAGLAGLGTNLLGSWQLSRAMRALPPMPRRRLPALYGRAGLPRDFPTFSTPGLDNAAYAPGAGGLAEELSTLPDYARRRRREPGLDERVERDGAVLVDPRFMRAGVLAHEAGHARLEAGRPWHSPSRINQRWLRPASTVLSLLAPAGGLLAGARLGNPWAGGLAGAGVGLAASLPTLVNEFQASRHAFSDLDRARMGAAERDAHKGALRQAFGTYLTAAALTPALAGAAGGYFLPRLKQAGRAKPPAAVEAVPYDPEGIPATAGVASTALGALLGAGLARNSGRPLLDALHGGLAGGAGGAAAAAAGLGAHALGAAPLAALGAAGLGGGAGYLAADRLLGLLGGKAGEKPGEEPEENPAAAPIQLAGPVTILPGGVKEGVLASPWMAGAKHPALEQLLLAKAESDRGNYLAKHRIMRQLLRDRAGEFVVDSDAGDFPGLTHRPTRFRMHLPRHLLPPEVLAPAALPANIPPPEVPR